MKQFATDSKYDRYVLLDRDGVINVERGDYTMTIDEWQWADGAFAGIQTLTKAGFGVIVITNQACIHKGRQSHEGLDTLHRFMIDEVSAQGGDIVAVYYCPHWTPDNCSCRKPKPGLLIEAAQDYGIELAETYFIGDAARDVEAGKLAGARTILLAGTKASENAGEIDADKITNSLAEAVEFVIAKG